MADDDSGGMLDPQGLSPVGTTTASGIDANNPLVDWASNLHQEDLANLLQDPYRHAQAMAARGIGPPNPDDLHNANDQAQTPTNPNRFDQNAQASPLDQPPIRTDPRTGAIVGNITDQPDTRRAIMSGSAPLERGGTVAPGSGSVTEKLKESYRGATTPQEVKPYKRPGWDVPRPASEAATPPARLPAPPAVAPAAPAQPPAPAPAPAPAPPPPVQTAPPPGAALNAPEDQKKLGGKETPKEKTKIEQVGDALSDLGKAMQGVKAPEPLKPPSSFAPAPHPTAAPSIGTLLAALGQARAGQVPPSAMPVLRSLLGR